MHGICRLQDHKRLEIFYMLSRVQSSVAFPLLLSYCCQGKPHLFYLFQANNWKYNIVFTGRRPDLMMALSAFTIGNDDVSCNRKKMVLHIKSVTITMIVLDYMFQIFFNLYDDYQQISFNSSNFEKSIRRQILKGIQ